MPWAELMAWNAFAIGHPHDEGSQRLLAMLIEQNSGGRNRREDIAPHLDWGGKPSVKRRNNRAGQARQQREALLKMARDRKRYGDL